MSKYNLLIGIEKIKNLFSIKFVKDTGFTIGSHFLVGISGLLINTIIGNNYGVASLGIINQALSIYMILALVSNFGIQTSAQKHTSQHLSDKNLVKTIFSNAVIATLLSSLLIIIVFLVLVNLFPKIISSEELWSVVKILIFGVPLFALNKTINDFMTGMREMKIYSIVRVIRWTTIILLIFYANATNRSIITIAYSFIVSEVLILIYFLFRTKEFWGNIQLKWIYKHLSFGVKTIMAEFIATFNTRIPILIIGFILGDEAAGYYSYIEVFAFSILMISSALQKNFNPLFTKLWYENNISSIEIKIRQVFKISSIILLPILVLLYAFYYIYTSYVMISDYLDYSLVLIVLFLGVGLRFLFGPFFTFLIMANYLYANLLRAVIYASVNIILIIVFLKLFGLIGVPLAYTISLIINILILNYLYIKKMDLNLFKIILKKQNG